jgi:hypothetical protein
MPTLYKASNGLPNPLYTNPLARALTAEPRRPRQASPIEDPIISMEPDGPGYYEN